MDTKRMAGSLIALAALATAAPAQDLEQDWGAWFAFAGQGHFAPASEDARWRWWFDAHARFRHESDGFDQSIVRPGVGYDLTPASTLWAGYGWIVTDPAAAASFDEQRIWQQYTFGRKLASEDTFFARSRLEQRFVETGDDTGWRFRQFLRWTTPLGGSPQLAFRLWDEIFLDLNDTDWGQNTGFDQNRLFAGFGWNFARAPQYTLEFGYLNQYVDRAGGPDGMNHILATTLLYSR